MAYAFKNTFEGGINGVAVSTANSGGASGDAFTHVILGTGASIQYGAMPWPGGGQGAVIVHGTSGATYLRWDDSSVSGGDTRRIARVPIWLSADLTGSLNLAIAYTNSDQAMGALVIDGTGGANHRKLWLANPSFGVVSGSFSAQLALTTLYWAEFVVGAGASSNGILGYRLLEADGVTQISTFTNSAITTRADVPARVRFGSNSGGSLVPLYLDDLRWEAASSGWLGPLSATPPTLALTDGVRHVIDARSSSVPVGSITYAISQESGPTVAAVEIASGLWHVTPHETDTLVYEVTASGSLGGSDSDTVEVPPLSAGGGSSPVEQLIWDGDDWV